jgi:hypothetical protein
MARMNQLPTTTSRAIGRTAAVAVAVIGLLAVVGVAQARPRPMPSPHVPAEKLAQLFPAQRGGGLSLAQATAIAQGRFQGRVIRAETMQTAERVVHEIRILGDDGRVRTVRIDAQTGSFL